jgi:hypothetical protein
MRNFTQKRVVSTLAKCNGLEQKTQVRMSTSLDEIIEIRLLFPFWRIGYALYARLDAFLFEREILLDMCYSCYILFG